MLTVKFVFRYCRPIGGTIFKNQLMIALVGMAILLSCNSAPEKMNADPTPEELMQMNKDFAKALNAKDAKAAAELYSEDASLLPPGETIITGRENIQKYWQSGIDQGISDVSVSTMATGGHGDTGYEVGRYQLSIRDTSGKVITEIGKYVEILKRGEDGVWKSTYGIWTPDSTSFTAK